QATPSRRIARASTAVPIAGFVAGSFARARCGFLPPMRRPGAHCPILKRRLTMPSDSILLVMDMINDLVHPDGPSAKTYVPICRERKVYENTALAIERARSAGTMVGYVRIGFSPDYRECPPASPAFSRARENGIFRLGDWGTE